MTQYGYDTEAPATAYPDLATDDETDAFETVPGEVIQEPAAGTDDAPEEDDDAASSNGAGTGARPAAAKPSKSFIRKVATKALEIETSALQTRNLAAALLGSSADTADLTAAIMTAGRGASQPLSDISEVADALINEPWEAGITATSFDPSRQKALWAVLHARDAVTTALPPKSLAKAGSAIVKAINGLTETDKEELAGAGELIKRS